MDTTWPRWRLKGLAAVAFPLAVGRRAVAAVSQVRLAELSRALENPCPTTRAKARAALVTLGKSAVPTLVQLLSYRKAHIRWEAAKALGEVADPGAATAMVRALEDEDWDVRWLAAEGLIALGQDSLQPLLTVLIGRADSDWLAEGAHHVCHALAGNRKLGPILRPLLAAFTESEPEAAVPLAAYVALSKLREAR